MIEIPHDDQCHFFWTSNWQIGRSTSDHEQLSASYFTAGHSTRSFDELVAMLPAHGVESLVDVRTIPRSRPNRSSIAKRSARS